MTSVARAVRRAGAPLALLVLLAGALASAAPAATSPPPSARAHQVQRGDTLSAIARRYGVTVPSLVRANGFQTPGARLKVGSRLAIPQASRPTPRAPARVIRAPGRVSGRVAPAIARRAAAPNAASAGSRVRRAALTATAPANLVLAVPEFPALPPAFLWPVEGALSSTFGRRRTGWHRGIDIMAPPGAPVTAAAPGIVIASGVEDRYGRVVKVGHDNGFVTVYAHNTQNLVDIGDWVAAGQAIATVGRTGRATSEHVHFEIRHEGRAYNPLYLLPLPPRIVQVQETESSDDTDDE